MFFICRNIHYCVYQIFLINYKSFNKNNKRKIMIKVLFVCLGNICRSPMAEFVFKDMVSKKGLSDKFEISSAATEGYNEQCRAGIHYGTKEILKSMKIPYTEHYSRKIRPADYNYFDYILAMDDNNVEDIQVITGKDKSNKIYRLLDFTENPRNIKDPWYTGNFDETYWDIIEGCEAFLKKLNI